MDIIERYDTVKNCPICNGEGFKMGRSSVALPTKNPGRTFQKMVTVECICKRNERIERRYPALNSSEVPKLTEAEVDNIAVNKFSLNKGPRANYKFFGDAKQFFKVVKASFVYLTQDASARFYLGTGIEIIKDYYVGADERNDFMALLNDFDLIVIMFDSRIKNKALKPVMVDLIQTRLRKGLATWVWSEGDIAQSEEWSEDLANLVGDPAKFIPITLGKTVKDANRNISDLMGNFSTGAPADA
jgi:hypothetical protein